MAGLNHWVLHDFALAQCVFLYLSLYFGILMRFCVLLPGIWWHLPMIVLLLLFCSALVFLGHRITKRRRRRLDRAP